MGLRGIYKSNICLEGFTLLEFVSLIDKVKVDKNLDLPFYNSQYKKEQSQFHKTNRPGWGLICSYLFPVSESCKE